MPFLAAPVIAAIIGGGASIGSSLIAKGGKKSSASGSSSNDALTQGITGLQNQSQQLIDTGLPVFKKGAGTITDLIDKYYSPLAYGNKEASNRVLANPISDVNQGYKAFYNKYATSGARSGGLGATLGNANIQRLQQIAGLRFGAQNDAASGLQTAGSSLLGGGGGLASSGISGLGSGLQALIGQGQLKNQAQANKYGLFGGLGETAGNILAAFLLNKKKDGEGGGSSSGDILGGLGGIFGGGRP